MEMSIWTILKMDWRIGQKWLNLEDGIIENLYGTKDSSVEQKEVVWNRLKRLYKNRNNTVVEKEIS